MPFYSEKPERIHRQSLKLAEVQCRGCFPLLIHGVFVTLNITPQYDNISINEENATQSFDNLRQKVSS